MKKLLITGFLTLIASSSFAGGISSGGDCFPVEWNLPDEGTNCSLLKTFPNIQTGQEFQLWSCLQNKKEETYLMEFKVIVEDGEFKGCREFEKLIEGI